MGSRRAAEAKRYAAPSKSREMPKLTDEMKQLVERQRLGFVATVCPNGMPNLSPKGTVCVLDDDHLIFADIRSPATDKPSGAAGFQQQIGAELARR